MVTVVNQRGRLIIAGLFKVCGFVARQGRPWYERGSGVRPLSADRSYRLSCGPNKRTRTIKQVVRVSSKTPVFRQRDTGISIACWRRNMNRDTRIAALMIIPAVMLAGVAQRVSADTITVAGCSQAAVQSAVTSAASGDTVLIGSGTCSWTQGVNIAGSTRNISVKGAGIGQTVINAQTGNVFTLTGGAGYRFELAHMTINAGGVPAGAQQLIQIGGSGKSWRVHNLAVTNTGRMLFVFTISGETYGVLDHLNISGGNSGVANVIGGGFPIWNDQTYGRWGDEKAIFLESSTVTLTDHNEGRLTIDCEHGGRYVLRHNTITNQRTGNHGLDSGGYASCLSAEIYNNTFRYTPAWDTISAVVFWRGGTALIHNNVFDYHSGTWGSNHILLPSFRAGDGEHPSWPACNGNQYRFSSSMNSNWTGTVGFGSSGTQKVCTGNRMRLCTSDSACSSNGEGTCSEFVDGQSGSGAYPCFMQPGRGVRNLLSPIHEWNNRFSGGIGQGGFSCPEGGCNANISGGSLVQAGRDYHNDTPKPGYLPYAYPHPLTGAAQIPAPPNDLTVE